MAYKGMRWLKCDLQMQTPADASHWRGKKGTDAAAAEAFMSRCFDVGLNCIAITDHNFASKEFIALLDAANEKLATARKVPAVHIFPGFELQADIAKGIHALAIFDRDVSLDAIDHKLTECGVPPPRFTAGAATPSTKKLREIIALVQQRSKDGRLQGLIVCAHPLAAKGLFDKDSISDWLQQSEWQNAELLAVEVPKPVEQFGKNFQKLFENGTECRPEWKRIRPIGRFMSSDCKALTEVEDKDNFIGKRFCWVKMSEPSIESLRQACLDHESRVCLAEVPPEAIHTRITRVGVSGARFLRDQVIELSPHLNCIIGGRGSGKSTILEYLRLALRALPKEFDEGSNTAVGKQIRRIRQTIKGDTAIEVVLHHGAVVENISYDHSVGVGVVTGREVGDQDAVFQQFGVLAFSQEEITELASGSTFLSLIDDIATIKLADLTRRESEIRNQVRVLFAHRRTAEGLASELVAAEQRLAEIRRQFEASSQLQGELKGLQAAEEAAALAKQHVAASEQVSERLATAIADLEELRSSLPASPSAGAGESELKRLRGVVEKGLDDAIAGVASLSSAFARAGSLSLESVDVVALVKATEDAQRALDDACKQKGVSPAVVEQLQVLAAQQAELNKSIESLKRKLTESQGKAAGIPELMETLNQIWTNRADLRRQEMAGILESPTMPRTKTKKPILVPTVIRGGDRRSFMKTWSTLCPDGRSRLGRHWDEDQEGVRSVGNEIFDAFQADPAARGNPIWWLDGRLDIPNAALPGITEELREDIRAHRARNRDQWEQATLTWVDDSGDIKLLRSDDSIAGSLSAGDLSDGQRNTAMLSLLLARGSGPVLIDQPENELDSAFLFEELVPMLRQAKMARQLIVVTHNANIPVNADAELICALESTGGRGVLRAEGGLDVAQVSEAVLDIMEGSEEAFRRRFEKYHY